MVIFKYINLDYMKYCFILSIKKGQGVEVNHDDQQENTTDSGIYVRRIRV